MTLLNLCLYTVFQKSDAKIPITITTAYLIRIKYPLSGFNYHLSDVNVANFNKIHRTVCEQQLFQKWNSKTEVSNVGNTDSERSRVGYAPLGSQKRQVSAELLRNRSTSSKSVMVSGAVPLLGTIELMFIDRAVRQWRVRLRACVCANGGHVEHKL